jgi:hypothetical protein
VAGAVWLVRAARTGGLRVGAVAPARSAVTT